MINEGVNAGIFECDDPAQATRALLGVMNWTITWFKVDGLLSVKDIADQYANLFFQGLLRRV
jgi:hypothetical protein